MSATGEAPPLDPAYLAESRAHVPIAVVSVVLSFATLAVAARSYARTVLIHQFGMDDWSAIVALILALGSGIMVASSQYLPSRHLTSFDTNSTLCIRYDLRSRSPHRSSQSCKSAAVLQGMRQQIPRTFQGRTLTPGQTFYISIVLYNGSLTAIKITFLLQYYRILGTARKMRLVILGALVFVSLWSISQLLVTTFTCTPIEKFWMGDAVPGTCIPNLPFWYINAAGNILTDVIVFIVPLPALSGLNLRKAQKIMLLGIFSLGFFVSSPVGLLCTSVPSLTWCYHRPAPSPSSASNIFASAMT